MIWEQFGELKCTYRHREFWCRGYHVDTAGRNKAKTAEYIMYQPAGDKLGEQLNIPYAGGSFTVAGSRNAYVRSSMRLPGRGW